MVHVMGSVHHMQPAWKLRTPAAVHAGPQTYGVRCVNFTQTQALIPIRENNAISMPPLPTLSGDGSGGGADALLAMNHMNEVRINDMVTRIRITGMSAVCEAFQRNLPIIRQAGKVAVLLLITGCTFLPEAEVVQLGGSSHIQCTLCLSVTISCMYDIICLSREAQARRMTAQLHRSLLPLHQSVPPVAMQHQVEAQQAL